MEQKPLYHKLRKTTHNGSPHLDFPGKRRFRYDRHTEKVKNSDKVFEGFHKKSTEDKWNYDYNHLFKFLLKSVGKNWDAVWKECQHRLKSTEPVSYIVINIRKNGLPYFYDVKDEQPFARVGETTYYSTLYVDEGGILQYVDKHFFKKEPTYGGPWGESFNGMQWDENDKCFKKILK